MPYIDFAASYDEFDALKDLVDSLEDDNKTNKLWSGEDFIHSEFERIKSCASRDILIFNTSYKVYIRHQLIEAGGLTIRLLQLIIKFQDNMIMTETEKNIFRLSVSMRKMLFELIIFYENLGNMFVNKS